MSDSFWHFKVQCPVCKKVEEMADGFETDDLMAGCLDLSVNPAEQRQI